MSRSLHHITQNHYLACTRLACYIESNHFSFFDSIFISLLANCKTSGDKTKQTTPQVVWSSMRHGWGKPIFHSVISSKGKVSKVIVIGPITMWHFPEVSGTTLRYTGSSRHFDFFHPYTLPHHLHCLSGWQRVSYLLR